MSMAGAAAALWVIVEAKKNGEISNPCSQRNHEAD
jgi:hypothetical protein